VTKDGFYHHDVLTLVFQSVACEAMAECVWCYSGDSEGLQFLDQFLEVFFGGTWSEAVALF
jgi:hypothetical protein